MEFLYRPICAYEGGNATATLPIARYARFSVASRVPDPPFALDPRFCTFRERKGIEPHPAGRVSRFFERR